ncbi:hypothetical protein FTUN_1693 [Frigoriglobus tundricola]|uniref:Uncharacterized protein n=1 Tax=Frigoriglobus tundricola TaxID=2774151 RepID=A0A6M5YKS5_9BACT|nr:hypothetical protein FTUN_1693 [Frigoriglobus tundricola]
MENVSTKATKSKSGTLQFGHGGEPWRTRRNGFPVRYTTGERRH